MNNNEQSMVGRKVRFINQKVHELCSGWYPAVGTVGVITKDLKDLKEWRVKWPDGSTSNDDEWYCEKDYTEVVEADIQNKDNTYMPYDEIWKMLEPKMEKNGLAPSETKFACGMVTRSYYDAKDFEKAVALAYKVGYVRAMKGRPFKYGKAKDGDND